MAGDKKLFSKCLLVRFRLELFVADQLDEGCGTVGTLLNVTHDAPTPLGMTVWCETELVEVDGRRLVFDVAAYDAKGKIGGGRHERFIIQNEKFQAKANKKAEQ